MTNIDLFAIIQSIKVNPIKTLLEKISSILFEAEGIEVYSALTPKWALGDYQDTKIMGDVYVLSYWGGRKTAYITSIKSRGYDMTSVHNTSPVKMSFRREQKFQAFCKEHTLTLSSMVLVPQEN